MTDGLNLAGWLNVLGALADSLVADFDLLRVLEARSFIVRRAILSPIVSMTERRSSKGPKGHTRARLPPADCPRRRRRMSR